MYLYLWLKNWLDQQEGQDLVEYALLIALISVVAIVAITAVGQAIPGLFETVEASLSGAGS
jgi:pilus assembly protein Flp/PilA